MQELTEFNLEKTTAEIIILKDQTAQNIIEIGRRLIEVKENLGHGEFLNWLNDKVEFSRYTANRFMKIATEFSNVSAVQHLGSKKLFLLAGLEEEDRQEVMKENKVEDMTTRELERVIKEKKEIKKQLEEEQEYSQELQNAIKQKEEQIRKLKTEIENVTKPEVQVIEKEVVREVVPNDLILEKEAREKELQQLREMLKTTEKRAEKAENTLSRMKLDKEINQEKVYSSTKLENLLVNIKDFLDNASKYTYLKNELQKIPTQNKKMLEGKINEIENWVMLMRQALDNRQDVVGNIYYGEGERVNE